MLTKIPLKTMRFKLLRRPDPNTDDWHEWCTYEVSGIPALCRTIEEMSCVGYKFGQTLKVEVLYG